MSDDQNDVLMGKAAEYLVAASSILATRGELTVSATGAGLVFQRRGSSATLAVRVKARMSTAGVVQLGRVRTSVLARTFEPRDDLDVLPVAVDVERAAITAAWLVPSARFAELANGPDSAGKLRFSALLEPDPSERWTPYRLTAAELPQRILARLGELERSGVSTP
jgi:hypothetical protein